MERAAVREWVHALAGFGLGFLACFTLAWVLAVSGSRWPFP